MHVVVRVVGEHWVRGRYVVIVLYASNTFVDRLKDEVLFSCKLPRKCTDITSGIVTHPNGI